MNDHPASPVVLSNNHGKRSLEVVLLTIIAIIVLFNIAVYLSLKDPADPVELSPDEPSSPSFVGKSVDLHQTVIVPSLQTSLPPDRSAIWAATSNLAWKELHTLAGGDINIPLQPVFASEMNAGIKLKPGLEAKDYYAKAGFKSAGIYDIVKHDLATRFPKVVAPVADQSPLDGILAFSCFDITMKYQHAFLNDDEPLVFRDSEGKKTKIKSFGIRKIDEGSSIRRQIGHFFHDGQGHYAVDVSSGMNPYQLILACVERGPTLAATLADFEHRVQEERKAKNAQGAVGDDSILSIPNMEWDINHKYSEIVNQIATGPKLPEAIKFTEATQQIAFRMDRTGVSIASKMAFVGTLLNGDEVHRTGHYIFDRPFLIVVRRRNTEDPIFVMWVDNAELLQKK